MRNHFKWFGGYVFVLLDKALGDDPAKAAQLGALTAAGVVFFPAMSLVTADNARTPVTRSRREDQRVGDPRESFWHNEPTLEKRGEEGQVFKQEENQVKYDRETGFW
ncbi:hypothetical protein T440DRAFT_513289 [Plenodomus tracheiphilus IPT5]|uniref:Uncharacterized protein n=1 Tax=Plenodomus tracheiphilus IPT5 TaxID=1408161 RepID=A0A6A7BNU6_9PLEO|nr:hypothetical protein T440DRAFT_513289 [Plenodomus tracheiphilus IPT5]